LIEHTINVLRNSRFQISDCSKTRSCFDIIAKREILLFIKIISNIEGLTRSASIELRRVAGLVSALPLTISDHKKSRKLSTGVVYSRYSLPVMNVETLKKILSDELPLIYSIRGNYCMNIDPELLIALRRKLGMTQEELASRLGISKQSIYRYEHYGRMSLGIARRMMDFLDDDIAIANDFYMIKSQSESNQTDSYYRHMEHMYSLSSIKRIALNELIKIGFSAQSTNAPFDIHAIEKEEDRIFIVASNDGRRLRSRIDLVKEISDIIGGYRICISDRNEDTDITIMKPRELREISDTKEFIELIS
ncbi:MAG TPA: helix-turn-helix domain-containing protein, partial [Candidatus Altiarchaeales archaeon]|nr:helix-turn-helix domain-containing protein [Candidatus Altiarchaeales archaeon]